ncbi:MAG: SDR family oxidoreductase [Elusimicrobia bacterium]|nr:SDR family oxidoreductase [Elusimicrobiota bacterium]
MKQLKDRVVLVTGASSGIGWETALAFGAQGCRVALAARRAEKLRELGDLLRARGAQTLEIACDVQDASQVKRAFEATIQKWGRLDVLINNAGILEHAHFERQPLSSMEEILKTNLFGALYAVREAIARMRRQGEGHIVNVASIAGLMGLPYMAVYCASKFALVGLTESLRREFYGSGITLTAFCPGMVDTSMVSGIMRDSKLRRSPTIKTPQAVAQKIVQATRRRSPEIIYGDIPGALIKTSHFLPGLTDWAVHAVARRGHPLAKAAT